MDFLIDYRELYKKEPRLYYVKEKVDVYHKKFQKRLSWNWCAFVIPLFWFPYRKMYVETVVLYTVSAILSASIFYVSELNDNLIFYCWNNLCEDRAW